MPSMKKRFRNIVLFLSQYILIAVSWFLSLVLRQKCGNSGLLFLEVFPVENSGYQYRAGKWAELFREAGIRCEVKTLVEDRKKYDAMHNRGDLSGFMIRSLWTRFRQCIYSRHFKTVIVRRELLMFNDYGNLFMDKFLLRIHSDVVFDFDDDIAVAKKEPRQISSFFGKIMRETGTKFTQSLRLYKRFIVVSEYLKQYVIDRNPSIDPNKIAIIPTCVDYDKYPAKQYSENIHEICFGWIGGGHNYFLLDKLIPVFETLSAEYSFRLIVIGGKKYERETSFKIDFYPWSYYSEIENLYKIDIGLMPLQDDNRSKGKGGFKLLQYMGLGIVSLASAITINREIVEHGKNSLLVYSFDEWENILRLVLDKKIDFVEIGANARKTVAEKYTFVTNFESYRKFVNQ